MSEAPFQAYTFDPSESEELDVFADQLNGLRVVTIDWKKVAASLEPWPANSVDVMVYYRYGAPRRSPPPTFAIPEGVR